MTAANRTMRFRNLLASVMNAAAELAQHGRPMATDAEISARLEVCQACDQFDGVHCAACGCRCNGSSAFMNKLAYKSSRCPHQDGAKWKAIE